MSDREGALNRRQLFGTAALAGAAATAGPVIPPATARPRAQSSIGTGGTPTELTALAWLAARVGRGEPLVFCDLAAVDQNTRVILDWARQNDMAVRPALKAFQSPGLCAYILRQLPEPRGLLFHLRQAEEILAAAPPGTDLLMGYPPTVGQLEHYLGTGPPRRTIRHKLRLLVDSVPLLERLAHLARNTRRSLPLDVAIEFDSGMGRGGVKSEAELTEVLRLLRANRRRLRLGATLCYDGHATLDGAQAYRRLVAQTSRERYRTYLDQLAEEGAGLYDDATLIRNGPASSNYRNWAGSTEANEISPGSAFLFAGYLEAFDHDGLAPAITQASPVMRKTSDHPSVPYTQTTFPGAAQEEVVIEAGPWAGSTIVRPGGMRTDRLSGGGFALVAPKGAVELGDYVLMRPAQTGDGIDPFGTITAIREGQVVRRWPTLAHWGAR